MRLRLPKPYTILITRTGEAPLTITLRPLPLAIAAVVLASLPVVWVTRLIHHNSQLSEQNESLTETAGEVLLELETLDAEIEDLRERAGLPEGEGETPQPTAEKSQGGVARTAPAEELFRVAKTRMPRLNSQLKAQVRPALENTLAAEAARAAAFPNGKPITGQLDVSSEFGLRRNPFGGRSYEMHGGIDFRGPIGTPIQATAEGIVVIAQAGNGYGKHVVIDHGYGYETLYAHLSAIEVEVGDRVQRGDVIGALGNTGRSSGPHLHYEIRRDGQAVNPRYYLKLGDGR